MKQELNRPMHNLTDTPDRDMLSGRLGVFAASWVNAGEKRPEETGYYIVSVGRAVLQIALYERELGWTLRGTQYEGSEDLIRYWMDLPKLPRER